MTATADLVHYRIPGDASATTLCGLDAYDEDNDVARTDEAGTGTCPACRKAADEDCGGPGVCDVCSRALAAVNAWAER